MSHRLILTIAVLMSGLSPALARPAGQSPDPATAAKTEDLLVSLASDGQADEDVEELLRDGAHLIVTRDLSELTDAMKEAEQVMQDALKDVAPADLQALRDFMATADAPPPPAPR